MSDRKNSDNQNTNTIYIPPEARNRRPQPPPKPLRRQPQQRYRNEQYMGQQLHSGEQYRQKSVSSGQQGYNDQPYREQPYRRDGYGNDPYYNDPYYNQPYHDQAYPNHHPQGYPYPDEQRRSQGSGEYYNQPKPRKKPQSQKSRKKRKKKSFLGRFLMSLLIIFLLFFGIYSCTAMSLINKMEHVDTAGRNRRSDTLSRSYVTNVLLIGTDGRTADERGRSDTMMLASVNSRTKKITLISFMRDCYVEIPDYGWDKLNASYSYGGAELLMDTIEHNFGIRIDDYVSVNFVSFANIVDSLGGIDVEVSEAEAREINTILQAEVNEIMGDDVFDDLLDGGGELHLSGKQALSYARIRYIGNADFERTERQRRVIELVMNKLKTVNPTFLPKLSSSVLPGVATNMNTAELYVLSLKAPFMLGYERQQLQIPAEGTYYGDSTPSGDALIVDFNANYNVIYETAFSE